LALAASPRSACARGLRCQHSLPSSFKTTHRRNEACAPAHEGLDAKIWTEPARVFFLRLPSIMPSGGAHPPHQKHVLFPFVLWGQKCCNETAAQIQFRISLSTRIPSYPNTTRIAIKRATLDNLLQQKSWANTYTYTFTNHSTYYK